VQKKCGATFLIYEPIKYTSYAKHTMQSTTACHPKLEQDGRVISDRTTWQQAPSGLFYVGNSHSCKGPYTRAFFEKTPQLIALPYQSRSESGWKWYPLVMNCSSDNEAVGDCIENGYERASKAWDGPYSG